VAIFIKSEIDPLLLAIQLLSIISAKTQSSGLEVKFNFRLSGLSGRQDLKSANPINIKGSFIPLAPILFTSM
jgi:hypothetical protein